MSGGSIDNTGRGTPRPTRSFDDRDIERLLRMAVEAEGLESPDPLVPGTRHAPGRRTPDAGRRWVLRRLAGGALATAALLVLGLAVFSQLTGGASPARLRPDGGISTAGLAPRALIVQPAAAGTDEDTVLLAVFHDELAGTRCVSWRDYDFGGNKCLGDVSEKELRGLCLRSAGLETCGLKPQQVMLVALAGPRHSLPESDSSAQQLADCILRGERMCDSAGACYVPAARGCVPKNVSFRIETVGLGG